MESFASKGKTPGKFGKKLAAGPRRTVVDGEQMAETSRKTMLENRSILPIAMTKGRQNKAGTQPSASDGIQMMQTGGGGKKDMKQQRGGTYRQ